MSFKIFYAWQSDTEKSLNWNFIGECIEEAIKRLKKKYKDTNPDFIYSRDTRDVPGWPNIPTTVYGKIDDCDLFIGDLSVIGTIHFCQSIIQLNSNVVGELNYALAKIGEERIINVMNINYGNPDEKDVIPFDFAQRRFPIQYNLSNENIGERDLIKEKLVGTLYGAMKAIFDTEHERRKKEYEPFETWKSWDEITEKKFKFESNEYAQDLFTTVREQAVKSKSATRILGLSGLGKTRLLLECFRLENGVAPEVTNGILYANMYDCSEMEVLNKCKELFRNRAKKIIVLDNCAIQFHSKIQNLFSNNECQLSLVTISTEPDENYQEIDSEGKTVVIKLISRKFNDVVTNILKRNFKELQDDEIALLVDYSNGLSFFAKLMADNPHRAKDGPGTLNITSVIERILGELYTNPESKAVILACCLFSKFGFYDELAFQSERIATSSDLCTLVFPAANPEDISELKTNRFKQICDVLHKRQLLEKIGRTFSFRPSPLAIKMAEEWWKDCTVAKFQRLIPILEEAQLVEGFCEQFRNLKHIDNAQIIVGELCNGVFSLAEVLNTKVGSRLFRSFVNVNPIACQNGLTKAFSKFSKNEVKLITSGRRNLVWALEKLCFRDETFDDATKILAAFSVGENEDIGNNATKQFLQLFHIHLPGTSVNLERRWQIVEYCLGKNDEDYFDLALDALNRCLTTGSFHRMGGAEDQGDIIPLKDYSPNGAEVWNYWKKAITQLRSIAIGGSPYSEKASDILFDKFYALCSGNAGELIIPVIKEIIEKGLIDKIDARKKIQFILNSKRVFNTKSTEELQEIYISLNPSSFLEKFKIYVQSPSSDEYYSDDEDTKGVSNTTLQNKIEYLATEFIENSTDWNEYAEIFTSGSIYEGFNFGISLSKLIVTDLEKWKFINLLIEKLKVVSIEKRNVSVLIGFLAGSGNSSIQVDTFNLILQNKQLRDYAFVLARAIELPFDNIQELLLLTEKGVFPTSQFSNFYYGWGIRHLTYENVIELINRLRTIDKIGKVVAFSIINKWSFNDKEIAKVFNNQIRLQLLNDSTDMFAVLANSMDLFDWSHAAVQILNESNDVELAKMCIDLIISESKDFEGFHRKETHFFKVLDVLQKKYFETLWEKISVVYSNVGQYGMAALHFKDLFGSRQDAYANTEGILFKDDPQKFKIIFEWSKANRGKDIYWVSELLPIYDITQSGSNSWHVYAKSFIDEFGDIDEVLSGISAKMGTYSWMGSVVPKLQRDRELFESLLNHSKENVRKWARMHINDLEKRIKWENNRDEDEIYNI